MSRQKDHPLLFYRGSSMKGTFKPGDLLCVEKTPFIQIHKGDLIIFSKTINGQVEFVAHRVVDTTPQGLVTRGDNCRLIDQQPIATHNIIGRIVSYERDGDIINAKNGWLGRIKAIRCHSRLLIDRIAKRCFRKPYQFLTNNDIISIFWQPRLNVLFFDTPMGPLIKVVRKKRTVAFFWIDRNQWFCRFPYKLIIKKHQGLLQGTVSEFIPVASKNSR